MKRMLSENNRWFDRKDSFLYLSTDKDNIVRVQKVIKYLSTYMGIKKRTLKLLDIGCGDGTLSEKFISLGYKVFGMDILSRNLKEATKKGLITVKADATKKLPYSNESFDVVFAGEIIEHLFDTKAFLLEINRVLKCNGLLIITTPNLAHFPDRINFLLGRSPAQIQPLHHYLNLHIRPFTLDTLKNALDLSGFLMTKHESTLVVFKRDDNNTDIVTVSSKMLASIFPTFGSFLIVYCRKV